MFYIRNIHAIIAFLLISGCSTFNIISNKSVKEFGYTKIQIQGLNFSHTIFENKKTNDEPLLHIYLGGMEPHGLKVVI